MSSETNPPGDADPLFAEGMALAELERDGKLTPKALARFEARMKERFDRESAELDRLTVVFKAEQSTVVPAKQTGLVGWRRNVAIVMLVAVIVGPLLEVSVGRPFVFAYSRGYSALIPWLFLLSLPLFLFLLIRDPFLRLSAPTRWFRWLIAIPLAASLGSGMVVMTPLGWAALAGLALGTSAEVKGRILSVGVESSRRSLWGCARRGDLAIDDSSARVCLDALAADSKLVGREVVVVRGRVSSLGVYILGLRQVSE